MGEDCRSTTGIVSLLLSRQAIDNGPVHAQLGAFLGSSLRLSDLTTARLNSHTETPGEGYTSRCDGSESILAFQPD